MRAPRLVIGAVALLVAGPAHAGANDPQPEAYVLGRDEVRAAAAIETYRLEKAYYDHLVQRARDLADARGIASSRAVTIEGVEEPVRPIIDLPNADRPRRGPKEAPVQIVVVENLSQRYSQRLDVVIEQMLARYGERLAVSHHDFVDRVHPGSLAAAAAARCAAAQGEFWPYRSLLLANLSKQSRADLASYAEALALDPVRFGACLDAPGTSEAVRAETAVARARGITAPPVLLINGRYARGVESPDVIDALIADALPVEGTADALDIPETSLGLALTGIAFLPGTPRQAMIVAEGTGHARIYGIGDRVASDAVITAMAPDHVLLRHGRRTERLTLGRRGGLRAAAPVDGETLPAVSDRALVTRNVAKLRLGEDDLQRLLAQREALEGQFAPAELDMGEGNRLLKITGDEYGPLLALLGLQHRDVLLRVNDEFVYDGRNTLFDSIAERRPTTMVLLRRGISHLIELEPAN